MTYGVTGDDHRMLDNYRDLIDELLGTPTALRELATDHGGALPTATRRLVAELRDRDQAVLTRLQTMTRQTSPHLRSLAPAEAIVPDDPIALLSEFDTARGELVSLLMNLTIKDWQRMATDDAMGETSLADEVERHVEFDEMMVGRLRQQLGDREPAGA